MSIIKKKLLFKGAKARPEVMKQGVRSELGTFVYDLGVVASSPSDKIVMIGASKFYLEGVLVDFPETAVNLGSGAYQVSAFTAGLVKRILLTINPAGDLVKYEGTAVVPPTAPTDPILISRERPVCLITVTSVANTPGGIGVVAQADIIQLNLSDWRTNTTIVVPDYDGLSSIVSPVEGDVVFVLDRSEFYYYNGGVPLWQRVGNTLNGRVSIPADTSSVTIVFAKPMRNVNYVVSPCFFNDTDVSVQYQPITVTAQTVNGFTVKWNSPTDSANYKLQYITSSIE